MRLNPLNNIKKQPPSPGSQDTSASGERRRLGKIVHDDRGTAMVEWHDAPEDMKRDVLSIEDGEAEERSSRRRGLEVFTIRNDDTFNPYERKPGDRAAPTGKRDLRKLSQWIKMMRELEERKARGDGDNKDE